ncbi:hypothetical protein CCR75_003445 [Bremia lactucae]|uniref:Uncharacterized protein n=1 Tax=Bremia lactucae TaxID=4779 RepID=A0A976FJR6_BRELC|nr:hypothetical protein CCR75_003445 [Bremia lactucae]
MFSNGPIKQLRELLPRDDTPRTVSLSFDTITGLSKALNTQRKIDTTTLLLDNRDLLLAMRFDAVRQKDSHNARERPRQTIILC